jgi:hypothetical protein
MTYFAHRLSMVATIFPPTPRGEQLQCLETFTYADDSSDILDISVRTFQYRMQEYGAR